MPSFETHGEYGYTECMSAVYQFAFVKREYMISGTAGAVISPETYDKIILTVVIEIAFIDCDSMFYFVIRKGDVKWDLWISLAETSSKE